MRTGEKRILILGGGFGGVYTARHLEKLLKPNEAALSLVNRENYWVYQPMIPEVISGSIGLTDVVAPIRQLCSRTELVMREVEAIDLRNRVVTVSPGFRPRKMELSYDYLVIALGSTTKFSGMPGMLEHALPFRNLADAMCLRNHVINVLEEAEVEPDSEIRSKLLTFVVAGGGFSGVEVIAELNDFIQQVKRRFPRLRKEKHRCLLIHSGDRILPEVTAGLAEFAEQLLHRRGVEILLHDRLVAATSEKAILRSKMEIPTKTVISTVPAQLPPVLQKLDCTYDKGRLLVNGNLELAGYEGEVWALGDCASITTISGQPVPPTAQHAVREAKAVASNIVAAIQGRPQSAFAFEALGKLGSLGHYSAVAETLGMRVSGFPAWCLWRTVYLMKVPTLNRKVRIFLDWVLSVVFPPDLVEVRTAMESGICKQHFEADEMVFFQGDVGDKVYIIESGECEVLQERDGVQTVVATLRSGDYFGEMAVLMDCSRNATIRARTRMDVLLVSKNDFDLLKASVPAFYQVFSELAKRRSTEAMKSSA
ncbi:MAG: FAD-dependent oxidoreductase [Acidobacteriia bacterium]|nr:FAD-dependent oxidoreductase [Terriglobia bacterium]